MTVMHIMEDNVKKSLNLVVLCASMSIFFLFVFFRVELLAKQIQAETKLFTSDADWQAFQYQQAVRQAKN